MVSVSTSPRCPSHPSPERKRRDRPPAVRDPPASAGGFYSDGLCGRDIDVRRVTQSFQELLAVFPCEAEGPNVRCAESSDDGGQISSVWLRERLLHDRCLGPVDERLQGKLMMKLGDNLFRRELSGDHDTSLGSHSRALCLTATM